MEKIGSWWSGQKTNLDHLFFYLILLFLPTQLGRHFWPSFSFIYGIRVDYLSPTLYLTDILIFFLFVFWALLTFKKKKFLSSILRLKKLSNSFKLFFLFLTIIIVGIILSNNQLAGWYGLIKLMEFMFFGFYTLKFINKERFKAVLILFSITVIFESILSIFQFINKESLGGLFYFFGERAFNGQTPGIANASLNGELVLRPYATFSHPNVLAGFLIIGMTLLIYNSNLITSRFNKMLINTAFFLGTVSLFLTMSRIAILLWLLIIIILGVRKINNKLTQKHFLIYLITASLLIAGILFTPIGSRFINLNFSDEVFISRIELIRGSIQIIVKNPVLGVGINNYFTEFPQNFKTINSLFILQPVHNIYLLIASQIGLIGLSLFFRFILKTYRNLRFTIYDLRFTILSGVLILGFFDHYFLTLQQGQLLFSFILGICWSKKLNLS